MHCLVGKSDFASRILFFGEYFSKFFRVFFRVFQSIFPNFPDNFPYFLIIFPIKMVEDQQNVDPVCFSLLLFFRILSIFLDFMSIFSEF